MGTGAEQQPSHDAHVLPMIIVGPACYRELLKERKGKERVGLLRLHPDYPDKMAKKKNSELLLPPTHAQEEKKSEWPYPLDDFDTAAYRTNWSSGMYYSSLHTSAITSVS